MAGDGLTIESNYKKFGYTTCKQESIAEINGALYRPYIKVLFVPAGYGLTVDFKLYEITRPSLFFINSNQCLNIDRGAKEPAKLLYYNRDFYFVQIHDDEVACDGLLFNNIFEMPKVELSGAIQASIDGLFNSIREELVNGDASSEEMIRTYLKQMIIRATREWKKQNLQTGTVTVPQEEIIFFRNYSRLVEIHFREKHSVAEYAALLNLAPKTVSVKFRRLNLENPNDIIKNRIILEAKRLLKFTDLSIKEIAYQLGYDDPAYFNRMFTSKTKVTPANFRKEFI